MSDREDRAGPRGGWFSTTHWSVVLAAGSLGEEASRDALATLCRTYWRPVHAFVRSQGHDAEAARDLTQAFFTTLLERGGVAAARRDRGRFRTFLLASVKNFLSHERERAAALKRGGGHEVFQLPDVDEPLFASAEPATHETPETIYEQRWAVTLLERTMQDVEAELERQGSGARFRVLREFLVGDADPPYDRLARTLDLSEATTRVTLHRLRRRFGAALRDRVAETVEDRGKLEDELRHLIHVMSAGPR